LLAFATNSPFKGYSNSSKRIEKNRFGHEGKKKNGGKIKIYFSLKKKTAVQTIVSFHIYLKKVY
jgi:hypothetical protein